VTLAEAAEVFAASEMLRTAMGAFLHDRVAAVRRAEAERCSHHDEEALVSTYRWRY
jgi:hypothetical protein